MISTYAPGKRVLWFVVVLCILGAAAGFPSRTPTRTPSPSPLVSPTSSPTPSATPSVSTTPTPSVTPSPSLIPSPSTSPSTSSAPTPSSSTTTTPSVSSIASPSITSFPSPTTTPSSNGTVPLHQKNHYSTLFFIEVVVPSVSGVIFIGGVLYFVKKRKYVTKAEPDIQFEEFHESPGPLASPAELTQKTIGIFLDGNFVHATFLGRSGKPLCKSIPCMLLYDKLLGSFMYDGNVTDECEAVIEILRLLGEDEEDVEKITKKWWGETRPVKVSKGTLVINHEELTATQVLAKILHQLFLENATEMENFNHCLVAVPAFVYFNKNKQSALLESFRIAIGDKCNIDFIPQHRLALDQHQHENGTVFVSLTSYSMEVVKKHANGQIFGSYVDYGTRDVAYRLWKNSQSSWKSLFKKGCDLTWFVKQIQDVEAVIRKHIVEENAAKVSTVRDVDTSDLEKVMGAYNECIRKILILSSHAHVIDFSTFSFQTLLKTQQLDTVVKVDQRQVSEMLDLVLFRCVDFQSNAS